MVLGGTLETARSLLSLLPLLLLAGCPGSAPVLEKDVNPLPLQDLGQQPADTLLDREQTPQSDSAAPQPDSASPLPDGQVQIDSKPQGTSCSDQGITITVSASMQPCLKLSATATAGTPLSWVMVGITSAKSNTQWFGGATNITCNGTCSWTFPDVTVPCDPGPYSLSLMRDAENDDPSKGVIVATCTP
jgi:hypothetical protein